MRFRERSFRPWKAFALLVVAPLALMLAQPALQLRANSLTQFKAIVGRVVLSEDACGSNTPQPESACTVDIVKPSPVATVRQADLFCATTGFSGYMPLDGDVTVNTLPVTWDEVIPNAISSFNGRDDVTAIVKPLADAALPGVVIFTITENPTFSYDGCIMKVIWDDPTTTQNSILVFWGAQSTTGDTFVINFAQPLGPTAFLAPLEFSLGISFGFQPSGQFSQVDVNTVRLTTSAGGQDDGQAQNGALITVGGTGDTPVNPPPMAPPTAPNVPDDELYDLRPFVTLGDTSMTIFTLNPSNDDNIFIANVFLRNVTVVTPEPPPDEEDEEDGEDEDDFDEDGERDDGDEDDDNDGESDGEDEDDDNDGESDGEDEDDDNDGINDLLDSESTREFQWSSTDALAARRYTDYKLTTDAATLLLAGLIEGPDAEYLTSEIYNPAGQLVAVAPPAAGRVLVTAPSLLPGTYTLRVRNTSALPVNYKFALIRRVIW